MPTGKMTGVKDDKFVREAFTDTTKLQGLWAFAGFLGLAPGENNDRWRLFFTIQLDTYVEFRSMDVLYHQGPEREVWMPDPVPADPEQTKLAYTISNPLGGHVVWLKKDALLHFEPPSLEQQATFISGSIAAGYMPQMGGPGLQNLPGAHKRPPGWNAGSDLGCTTLPLCQS